MQLAIDAADDNPGVALAVDGVAGMTATWATQRNHSVELLPNIDRLLTEAGRTKGDIGAVFVDLGPGGYAALRVGVSIAKALAHGLGVPIVGVGRLELDAYGVAGEAGTRRIVAVHRAGRGEAAWAAYRDGAGAWREELPPRISKPVELHAAIASGDIVTGDIDEGLAVALTRTGASAASANAHRVIVLASLGHRRLDAGRTDDPMALVPLYLRAPAIGPQPSAGHQPGSAT
jgi:tRNA threonylcarbamoyladenosine biosynthesis protein TsaB